MVEYCSKTFVQLGQCAVVIRNYSQSLEPSLQFLLRDLKSEKSRTEIKFTIDDGKTDAKEYVIKRGDSFPHRAKTAGEVCTYLIGEIIYHLIDKNEKDLLLHAACLTYNGMGLLLPGVSGAGKSTITAWLLENGFGYLTDEIVSVNLGTWLTEGLARPLNIKLLGMEAIRNAKIGKLENATILDSSISHLVEHRAFNPHFVRETTHIKVIVFPRYSATKDFSLTEISSAKVTLLLMQAFVNARNHAEHGFHDISKFARSVKGLELTYSNFDELAALKQKLLEMMTDQRFKKPTS